MEKDKEQKRQKHRENQAHNKKVREEQSQRLLRSRRYISSSIGSTPQERANSPSPMRKSSGCIISPHPPKRKGDPMQPDTPGKRPHSASSASRSSSRSSQRLPLTPRSRGNLVRSALDEISMDDEISTTVTPSQTPILAEDQEYSGMYSYDEYSR
eukprot:gnl/Carplike_NY0171/8813_a12250_150.p1 GENE.gnl/Carplike_NY0171/8813_a12250_150~~gnl/Carplike_NY0171/8813_a12250_150.p1  ORF type:complete len:182 (+),score=48.57 gnl/Carplike_NY0171/8813_a12250_150:83-547(+)